MAYKVNKGKESLFVSAVIFDGRKKYYGKLGEATQEELQELFAILPKYISKSKKTKRKSKKRDNDPGKPLPQPPKVDEPKDTNQDG